MTDPVIRAESVGKKYILGQGSGGRQRTFRESVTDAVKAPLRGLARGRNGAADAAEPEEFWAVRDVSFEIGRGEVVGIIGRNGAGKSTLLKILSRITEPTKGRITLNGRVASLLEVGTGFHQELTGRENIFLNGAILGMHRSEIKAKFDEIVAFSEVEKFLDTPVKRYSSGMYVRLAFAVAAHLEPEILIVDEVLAVGDAQFQKRCLGKMQEVAQGHGRTVLFVSHNMASVQQLCTRAFLLNKGSVQMSGDPLEVIDGYLSLTSESGFSGGNRYDKEMWISDARTINPAGEVTPRFTHQEPIRLALDVEVAKAINGGNVGVVLKDSRERIVFRSEIDLPPLPAAVPEGGTLPLRCEGTIPGGLLVPGRYFLTLFMHVPIVRMLFLADDALSLSIIDAGSVAAQYEGKADYGCVFVDCHWQIQFP